MRTCAKRKRPGRAGNVGDDPGHHRLVERLEQLLLRDGGEPRERVERELAAEHGAEHQNPPLHSSERCAKAAQRSRRGRSAGSMSRSGSDRPRARAGAPSRRRRVDCLRSPRAARMPARRGELRRRQLDDTRRRPLAEPARGSARRSPARGRPRPASRSTPAGNRVDVPVGPTSRIQTVEPSSRARNCSSRSDGVSAAWRSSSTSTIGRLSDAFRRNSRGGIEQAEARPFGLHGAGSGRSGKQLAQLGQDLRELTLRRRRADLQRRRYRCHEVGRAATAPRANTREPRPPPSSGRRASGRRARARGGPSRPPGGSCRYPARRRAEEAPAAGERIRETCEQLVELGARRPTKAPLTSSTSAAMSVRSTGVTASRALSCRRIAVSSSRKRRPGSMPSSSTRTRRAS